MSVAELDHFVLVGPDLEAAVAYVETTTGVRAAPGGRHPTGTANALIAFTRGRRRVRQYLEIIGPDVEAGFSANRVETFGIDRLTSPCLVTFAVRPDDIDTAVARAREAGIAFGDVEPLSRKTPDGSELAWRLAHPADRDAHPPFFIDWGETAHPALGDLPTLELLDVRRLSTDPASESERLAALGVATAEDEASSVDAIEVRGADRNGLELSVETADGAQVVLD